jgi:FkbM family methyltransferase
MKLTHRYLGYFFRALGKPRGLERVVTRLLPEKSFLSKDHGNLTLNGAKVRVWPRSRIGWNLFCFGDYEPELRLIFKKYVPTGGVVVEVGANIGWHLLLFSSLVGPAGHVHAFEPNDSVYTELKHNLLLNDRHNVTTWELALSHEAGTALFNGVAVNENGAGNGHLVGTEQSIGEPNFRSVKMETMDGLGLNLERLDLIKIDVEGAEYAVLAGAMATIGRFLPVVVYEHLEDFNERGLGRASEVMQRLTLLGYRFHAILSRGGTRPLPSVVGYSGDILALPPAKAAGQGA